MSPISNTSFTISWHVPKEARGTHHVVLEMAGVGTKTAGILKANYEFDLVLPPAEPVRSTQPLQRTGQQATEQQAAGQEKPGTPASTDRTNYPLVAAAVAIALLLMALHHRFGHAITGKTGEGEEEEEEGRQPEEPPEREAAGKPGKRKKPRAERRKYPCPLPLGACTVDVTVAGETGAWRFGNRKPRAIWPDAKIFKQTAASGQQKATQKFQYLPSAITAGVPKNGRSPWLAGAGFPHPFREGRRFRR